MFDVRVRRWLVVVLCAAVVPGALWLLLAPRGEAPAPEVAQVPDFQRSGPLANPWGHGVPVQGADAPAAASAAGASAAAGAAVASSSPAAARAAPTRESLRDTLAALRDAGTAAAFVTTAIERGEPSALAVAWMVERHCRQRLHWQQIAQWRQRAGQATAAIGARGSGAANAAATEALSRCDALPDAAALDAALEAAGFPATDDNVVEMTRRPVDLTLALAVGDPLLMAEVVDASSAERIGARLQAWGADPRDLQPDTQRAALWLATCYPRDARGQPLVNAAGLQPACRDHPALWHACMHQGLCDARDLRDMLLRTLPPAALAASERLARELAARVAR
ncbi:MAG: hypothetical protein KIT17_11870 [Rubrivivax sp.]|nr:hypothetical protein [Rubrivivax sp.]